MGEYLAMRIMKGKLDYSAVIQRYPQYKDVIVEILSDNDEYKSLITD